MSTDDHPFARNTTPYRFVTVETSLAHVCERLDKLIALAEKPAITISHPGTIPAAQLVEDTARDEDRPIPNLAEDVRREYAGEDASYGQAWRSGRVQHTELREHVRATDADERDAEKWRGLMAEVSLFPAGELPSWIAVLNDANMVGGEARFKGNPDTMTRLRCLLQVIFNEHEKSKKETGNGTP